MNGTGSYWNERRVAGLLLVVGFLIPLTLGLRYLPQIPFASALFDPRWERNLLSAGVAGSFFGAAILEGVLRKAGDRIFSRLGLCSYALATALWLVVNAISLDRGYWVDDLETYHIFLAYPAVIAFGVGILRTRLLPSWIGAVAGLWSMVLFIRVIPGNQGPLLYEPALLLIGVALLIQRGSPSGSPQPESPDQLRSA